MNMSIQKTRNAAEDGSVPVDDHGRPAVWCERCGNEGIVMLEGNDLVGGVEYTRGSTPCRWCDQGELRYAEWTAKSGTKKGNDRQGGKHVNHHRRVDPLSEFSMFDVASTSPEPRRSDSFRPDAEWLRSRVADGIPIGALQAFVPSRFWPDEWPAPTGPLVARLDDDSSVAEKRQLALQAKNEAEQEGSP